MIRALCFLLLLLGLAATPSRTFAADYYTCACGAGADAQCVAGNDTAAGNSPAAPWGSYERARVAFAELAAGDRIHFCRGGVFPITGGSQWVNAQCTASQPCTVDAYKPTWASGDEGRPRITRTNGHGISFADGGEANVEHGYVFSDLDLRCSACDNEAFGIFVFNDVDDVVLKNLRVSGFAIGVHVAGSNACDANAPNCDRRNDRVSLLNSDILDNHAMGWLGASSDALIADNRFLRNGDSTVFDHNLYINEAAGLTQNIRILRNELYRSSARTTGRCHGVSLLVHGEHDDLLIEGNLVYEDVGGADQECWGIGVNAAYDESEGFRRAIIRGNTVRNVGNAGIALSSCVDCLVENNRIEQQQPFYIVGVQAPVDGYGPGDLAMARLTARNNSIYATAPESTGVMVGGQGTGHIIVSNAIQATYSGGAWACLSLDLSISAYTAVDNNVCGYVAGVAHDWEKGSGSLAAWKAASGFDTHSLEVAPGFKSAGAPSHDLSATNGTSPMVNAGHASRSAPREFYGTLRPASPDAGAHEFGVTDLIFHSGLQATTAFTAGDAAQD